MQAAANVELVGVASRTADRADLFAKEFDFPRSYSSYEALLADDEIEAVHIPLPNSMHSYWTERALSYGKHVLTEKPFTTCAEEIANVQRVANNNNRQVMEAFMWRFHPQHIKAKEYIDSGALGKVRLMRAAFTYVREVKPDIRFDKSMGGGALLDVGCYPVSCARFYFSGEPRRVFATGKILSQYDVDLNSSCVLEFDDGVAHIDCGFHLPYRTDVEVVGEQGRIYFPRAWQPMPESTIMIDEETHTLPDCNHYVLMFERFSEAILNDTRVPFDLEDAIWQMRVLDAIAQSMRSGSPVELRSPVEH